MISPAQRLPSAAQADKSRPRVKPNRKPLAYKSPAPVVSTILATGSVGTVSTPFAYSTTLPRSLRVTAAMGQAPLSWLKPCSTSSVW